MLAYYGTRLSPHMDKTLQTDADIQSQDMRVIGTRKVQQKPNGAKLTGKGNIYYGTPLFTDMVLQYVNTGVMPTFDIQITNNDPTTSVGQQSMAYYGCVLTGSIPLSILNSEESMLNQQPDSRNCCCCDG